MFNRWQILIWFVSALVSVAVAVAANQVLNDGVWSGPWAWIAVAVGFVGTAVLQFLVNRATVPAAGDLDQVMRDLAAMVQDRWQAEKVVRSLDPPIPVEWHLTGKKVMDFPKHIANGELVFHGRSDKVEWLVACFRRLRSRRLVITGGPGTGKTTLALQLLLELLKTRTDGEPVPVLLHVADWDAEVHETIAEWVAARLRAEYAQPRTWGAKRPDTAQLLVERGHILLVLDGLDEMPGNARAAVLGQLAKMPDQQVILTSRVKEYGGAVAEAKRALRGAAVVAPITLSPESAADYLADCLTLPSAPWDRVLAALKAGEAPALSNVVTIAMGVWLVRAVYLDRDVDPTPLVTRYGADAVALRAHLHDNLVGALLEAQARAPRRRWKTRSWHPAKVHRWTVSMARWASDHGTRNISWWAVVEHATRPAGRKWPRAAAWWGGLWVGVFHGAAVAVTAALFQGVLFGVICGGVYGLATTCEGTRALDFRQPRKMLRSKGFAWSNELTLILLAVPIVSMLFWASVFKVDMRVFLEALIVFAGLAWWGLRLQKRSAYLGKASTDSRATGEVDETRLPPFTSAITPLATWRRNRATAGAQLVGEVMLGVGVGLGSGFVASVLIRDPSSTDTLQVIALPALVGLMLGMGLHGRRDVWLWAVATLPCVAASGRLPLRLTRFLDDMHKLGVLRATGPVYQFRHTQLHDHLVAAGARGAHAGQGYDAER